MWIYTTDDPSIKPPEWFIIPNAHDLSYQPQLLSQTTWFGRCVRRGGCWRFPNESNIVEKTILLNCEVDTCANFIARKERDIHLYRIIQESVNNIIKHSNAKNAQLSAQMNGDFLQLEVIDDGVGLKETQHKQGLGLSTIKTRTRCIGGKLSLGSIHGVGSRVTISVNIHNEDVFQ